MYIYKCKNISYNKIYIKKKKKEQFSIKALLHHREISIMSLLTSCRLDIINQKISLLAVNFYNVCLNDGSRLYAPSRFYLLRWKIVMQERGEILEEERK